MSETPTRESCYKNLVKLDLSTVLKWSVDKPVFAFVCYEDGTAGIFYRGIEEDKEIVKPIDIYKIRERLEFITSSTSDRLAFSTPPGALEESAFLIAVPIHTDVETGTGPVRPPWPRPQPLPPGLRGKAVFGLLYREDGTAGIFYRGIEEDKEIVKPIDIYKIRERLEFITSSTSDRLAFSTPPGASEESAFLMALPISAGLFALPVMVGPFKVDVAGNVAAKGQTQSNATGDATDATAVLAARLEAAERLLAEREQTIEDLRRRLDSEAEERRKLTARLVDHTKP